MVRAWAVAAWGLVAAACGGAPAPEAPSDEAAALAALGYVAEGAPASDGPTGVTTHEVGAAWPGTNLVVSAHAPEVVLLDLDGRVLHTWRPELGDLAGASKVAGFRRAWLLDGGDLLVILEGVALVRVDRDGRVRWASRRRHHHDVHLDPDGTIHALVRTPRVVRSLRRKRLVDDRIVVLDPADGRVLRETSLVEALAASSFREVIDAARAVPFDVLHTNSVERLDGRAAVRNPAFAAGSYLVSALAVDAVLVVDPEAGRVTWAQAGPWRRQHDAQVTADGRVLLFDNRPPGPSRLLAFDPADGAVTWTWDGGDAPFASVCCGAVQPLGHGGHLVTVTDEGRAVEVDRDGRVVWAWRSPHRVGDRVARLFDVTRAPPAEALPWLGAP